MHLGRRRCNIRAHIFSGISVLRCKGFSVLYVYVCRQVYIEARYTLWRGERYAAKQFLVLPESSGLQSICHDAPLVSGSWRPAYISSYFKACAMMLLSSLALCSPSSLLVAPHTLAGRIQQEFRRPQTPLSSSTFLDVCLCI